MYKHVSKLPKDSGLIYLDTFNASMLDNDSLLCSSVTTPFDLGSKSIGKEGVLINLYGQGFRYVVSDKSTHQDLFEAESIGKGQVGLTSVTQINFSKNYILYTITGIDQKNEKQKVSCLGQ
jgi:hypothetical protein